MEFKISLSKSGLYRFSTYYSLILLTVIIFQGLVSSNSIKETLLVILFIPIFLNIFIAWRKSRQDSKVKNNHHANIPNLKSDSY